MNRRGRNYFLEKSVGSEGQSVGDLVVEGSKSFFAQGERRLDSLSARPGDSMFGWAGNSMGQEISLWTWVVQHKGTISRCIQGHAHDVVLMVFEFMQHEGIQGKLCPRNTGLRVLTAVFAAQQVTYRS